jgi:hypothetical protein
MVTEEQIEAHRLRLVFVDGKKRLNDLKHKVAIQAQ